MGELGVESMTGEGLEPWPGAETHTMGAGAIQEPIPALNTCPPTWSSSAAAAAAFRTQ